MVLSKRHLYRLRMNVLVPYCGDLCRADIPDGYKAVSLEFKGVNRLRLELTPNLVTHIQYPSM